MEYYLSYSYTGHSELIDTFNTLEEAEKEFDFVLSKWGKVEPHDQMLEIWDEEGDNHKEHIFNEGNWESDE